MTEPISTELVAENLAAIRQRIAQAGGDPADVAVVAVTKTFGIDAVRAGFDAGLREFGENYEAELTKKASAFHPTGVRWHYLGAIQTNKLSRLVQAADCIESLSRIKEAEAIARRKPGATVMVQMDFTALPGRNGATQVETPALVGRARNLGLEVWGLMTVAPQDPDAARRTFRRVREMADDLGIPERSMGMTDDLEIAVEEGSTMVRVGRALFGARTTRT